MPFRGLRNLSRIARFFALSALSAPLLWLLVHPASLFAETTPKNARKVVVRVDPEYPEFLRNGHFEGRVIVEATVLANGSVSNVEIKGGNPMFAEYATKAVMKWKYAPAPAQTVEQISFHFGTIPR
ncbi:MAG TPA: energy transducer TonB [Candidatus Dormibacteraeota bacterium]|nr:energy transducer TonB [Candidatus Dormibacteraeota bacterium]